MSEFMVRPVERRDLDTLAAIEEAVYGPLGTPVMGRDILAGWYEEGSPYFLAAEQDGVIGGYVFCRGVAFSYTKEGVHAMLTGAYAAEHGEHGKKHDASSRCVQAVSVAALKKSAGGAVANRRHELIAEHGIEYFVCPSRAPGFASYLASAKAAGAHPSAYDPDAVALWYAHEQARILSMSVWDLCKEKPALALPDATVPDQVLSFQARHSRYGLLGVMPGYMEDPASKNYEVFLLSRTPHR